MVAKETIELLRKKINEADAIVVGGASGMSAASGFVFYYQCDEVFRKIAGSLEDKYGFHNFFDAVYHQGHTRGEHWAMILRETQYLYECPTGETYSDLAELLQGKTITLPPPTKMHSSTAPSLPIKSLAYRGIPATGNAAALAMTRFTTTRRKWPNFVEKLNTMRCQKT